MDTATDGERLAEPDYPLRCQHCPASIRLMPGGFYEDREGWTFCTKGVRHTPMPSETHLRHDDATLCTDQLCLSSSIRPHRAAHAEMFYVGETLQQRIGQHPDLRFHRIGRETFDPPAVPFSLTTSLATGAWTLVVMAGGLRREWIVGGGFGVHVSWLL